MWFLTLALAAPLTPNPRSSLDAAWDHYRDDDFAMARRLAAEALSTPGAHDQEASYLMGRCWQLEGHSRDALSIYRAALARQPHGAFTDQLEFHIAETLADTGEPGEARKWLRAAKRGRTLSIKDAPKFALNDAMFILQQGKTRRGTRKLLKALDQTDHDLATWHQAKARTLLVTTWLDVADELGTESPSLLERRAILIDGSRKQLEETIELDHSQWTLHQLMRIGQSYERLGDDVVTVHGRLASLPGEDREKVETVWVKATRFYDIGLRHAARTRSDFEQEGFEMAHAAVIAKVDQL